MKHLFNTASEWLTLYTEANPADGDFPNGRLLDRNDFRVAHHLLRTRFSDQKFPALGHRLSGPRGPEAKLCSLLFARIGSGDIDDERVGAARRK